MRALAAFALLSGFCLLCGCASSTTVVLMPDENGHVGALSVTTKAGSETIDRAFSSTVVDNQAVPPPPMREMGEQTLARNYGDALAAQPNPPLTYLVYFAIGSSALTATSMNTISEVVGSIVRRAPTEVALFGHADATGTERSNVRLSAERAKAVEQALRALDPDLGAVRLEYFGDKEPLVPSPPDVPEPMNRCVEILIL